MMCREASPGVPWDFNHALVLQYAMIQTVMHKLNTEANPIPLKNSFETPVSAICTVAR